MQGILTDTRKIFSIKEGVYHAGWILPGHQGPGPEAPRLTEAKTFDGKEWPAGEFDPEWVRPDEEVIMMGHHHDTGRMYYSLRADIATDINDTNGTVDTETLAAYDLQLHPTLPAEIYEWLRDSSTDMTQWYRIHGLQGGSTERFSQAFPNADAIKAALKANPNSLTEFLSRDAESTDEVMALFGAVKES
jgi:hypothetical protein